MSVHSMPLDSEPACKKCGEFHDPKESCSGALSALEGNRAVEAHEYSEPVCSRCGGPAHGIGPCPEPSTAFPRSIYHECDEENAERYVFHCPACGKSCEICVCEDHVVPEWSPSVRSEGSAGEEGPEDDFIVPDSPSGTSDQASDDQLKEPRCIQSESFFCETCGRAWYEHDSFTAERWLEGWLEDGRVNSAEGIDSDTDNDDF